MRILLALALLVALPALALDPIRVSASAYFVRGETGLPSLANRGFTSNAGFVVTPEGVVVFDTLGTPALGQELIEAIRSVTQAPIRRVIVSHYHADHFYGLPPFKDAGAEIWAHRAARGYLDSQAAKLRLQERQRSLAPWVDEKMRLVPADRWLEGEESFKLGGLTFRVFPVGPAHTAEDLAMAVEEENMLFVGDLMFAGRVPFVGDADSRSWIAAIDRIVTFKPKVMVGGHGDVSRDAAADLRMTRDYLVYLREKMGAAASELEDFEVAYAKTDWSRFAQLPAFEAANRRNAYNTYIRMQGGDR
ncbi:MAG TPA: MBL fold metallo-hydrolase [Burkholderiales bacterium]|nr:MBL fold metallo-hydrolase [Burkholderiales bacterium]